MAQRQRGVDGEWYELVDGKWARDLPGDLLGDGAPGLLAKASGAEVYRPGPLADVVYRTRLAQMKAGERQLHIAALGDSRFAGAAATGVSSPKHLHNIPGRLRKMLDRKYGPGGTGMVILDANVKATPAYDPRLAYSGTVNPVGFGFHRAAAHSMVATSGATMSFTADAEEFWVYGLQASGGLNTVTVDGGAGQTIANLASGGATPALPREAGYHARHIVTRVPAGAAGEHVLQIATNGTHNAVFFAVEGRIPTPGTVRVSNPSVSGKSLSTLFAGTAGSGANNDETNGLYGLPMVDTLRADLLLIELGVNDWQGGKPVAQLKADLTMLIRRQRSTDATRAGGDAMLVWMPQPSMTLQPAGGPSWEAYRQAFYEVADAEQVVLVDFGARWKDFATGQALGMFGDTIHENDRGAVDVAAGLVPALGL